MATRVMNGACLAACGLVALLLTGPPAHAQEPIRGISVFPEAETTGVIPNTTISEPPEFSYVVDAVLAKGFMFPAMTVKCLSGDILGFFVGSVFRVPVWTATLGDRTGIGERLDRLGTTIVEKACSESLFMSPGDLERVDPSPEPMTADPPPQGP